MDPQQQQNPPLGILGITGRNGSDSSFMVPDRQCLEARNIDWFMSSLGRKRGGASALGITGGTAFSSGAVALFRHVPAFDQTAAEFWAVDGASAWHRLTGGTAWADPTVVDAIATSPQEVNQISFNGKSYFAYDTIHNRLHVWDPVSNSIRRCGLDLPAAPTTGAPSAGAVTRTRKYRVSWAFQSGGITTRRSNLGPASGSVALVTQQVVVTRPTAPGEGETHWELWEAQDATFSDYRLLATTVIATTTATDNTDTQPSTTMPLEGQNYPPPSARYLVADDARVIMGGAWEASTNPENAPAPKNNRIWWTAPLGASDVGDDERVPIEGTVGVNNYADIEEAITGISQPMQLVSSSASSLERGSFYVFSYNAQWKFVSTDNPDAPYLRFRVAGGRGAVHHKSIVVAEDANGAPTIMWASPTGIMRISSAGQEFMGEDIVDIWARVNLDATMPCFAIFHPAKHQVWFYLALDGSLQPNFRVVFDTRLGRSTQLTGVRGGWSTADGEQAKAYCGCLFSDSVAASMGRSLKPYIGYTGSTAIWKCDTTDATDATNTYRAYLDTKSYAPWGLGKKGGMSREAQLIAGAAPGVTVQLEIYRDEGVETLRSTADLTPKSDSTAEVKVFPKFEASRLSDSYSFRCRIGDITAVASSWNLDAVLVFASSEGDG